MAKGVETRRRILDAARELIHVRSYNGVGVLQICAQAGVKKGSFYYFFSSKQALAFDMLDAMWEAETERVLAPAYESATPPLQRIARHATLRRDVSVSEQDAFGSVLGCPFGALATEMSGDDNAIRDRAAGFTDQIRARLFETLDDAGEEADLRGMSLDVAANALSSWP